MRCLWMINEGHSQFDLASEGETLTSDTFSLSPMGTCQIKDLIESIKISQQRGLLPKLAKVHTGSNQTALETASLFSEAFDVVADPVSVLNPLLPFQEGQTKKEYLLERENYWSEDLPVGVVGSSRCSLLSLFQDVHNFLWEITEHYDFQIVITNETVIQSCLWDLICPLRGLGAEKSQRFGYSETRSSFSMFRKSMFIEPGMVLQLKVMNRIYVDRYLMDHLGYRPCLGCKEKESTRKMLALDGKSAGKFLCKNCAPSGHLPS